MDMIKEMEQYLEFCKYRKELNRNTLKAYRIDLEQLTDKKLRTFLRELKEK